MQIYLYERPGGGGASGPQSSLPSSAVPYAYVKVTVPDMQKLLAHLHDAKLLPDRLDDLALPRSRASLHFYSARPAQSLFGCRLCRSDAPADSSAPSAAAAAGTVTETAEKEPMDTSPHTGHFHSHFPPFRFRGFLFIPIHSPLRFYYY